MKDRLQNEEANKKAIENHEIKRAQKPHKHSCFCELIF